MKLHDMKKEGFTLIEILLVIAIIAILAAIVIIAINPAKQLRDARNAERDSEVNTILNAISQYGVDNNGVLTDLGLTAIDTSLGETCLANGTEICQDGGTCTGLTDLSLLVPTYIVGIPEDPQDSDANSTSYQAAEDQNGRIHVCAPLAEGGNTLSVSR